MPGGWDRGPAPIHSPGKHKGWEGNAKGRIGFGKVMERCMRTAMLPVTVLPFKPSPYLIYPEDYQPSSLPGVPYHVAQASTEPLKLTITQSECLFGVIQAGGK